MSNGHRGLWDRENAHDLMTVKEAADHLRCHRSTIYRLLGANRLPGAFKIGSDWRISRKALDAALLDIVKLSYK